MMSADDEEEMCCWSLLFAAASKMFDPACGNVSLDGKPLFTPASSSWLPLWSSKSVSFRAWSNSTNDGEALSRGRVLSLTTGVIVVNRPP